jgi:hypothetical protein
MAFKISGRNSGPETELEKKFRLLGNLPSELAYPPEAERELLKDRALERLQDSREVIEFLDRRVKEHRAANEKLRDEIEAEKKKAKEENRPFVMPQGKGLLEEVNPDPEPAELNMQLALTRLVTDVDEQEMARLDGKAFQTKYNLTNKQMFTLCRLAVQLGFYKDTADLREYLDIYSAMSPEVHALTPDAIKRLDLQGTPLADMSIIGSCSCSCP